MMMASMQQLLTGCVVGNGASNRSIVGILAMAELGRLQQMWVSAQCKVPASCGTCNRKHKA
jgi:hypothetical protein